MNNQIEESGRTGPSQTPLIERSTLVKILAIICTAEFLTMAILDKLGMQPGLSQYLADIALLAFFSTPFLYLWIIREKSSRVSAETNLITCEAKFQSLADSSLHAQTALNGLLKISLENISLHEKLEKSLDLLLGLPWLSIESKGAVFVTEKTGGNLRMEVQRRLPDTLLASCSRVPFGKCLCGRAALSSKTVFAACVDERHDVRYEGMPPHGHYCLPIILDGKTQGVLNLYVKEGHAREAGEESFLQAAADAIGGMMQRARVEEQLHQAQKMEAVGRLAGGVAHDFNNLLTAILGGGTFLLQNLGPSDPNRSDVNEIIAAGKRAADLTRQLLIFSRRQVVEPQVVNFNELILQIDKMLRRVIGEDIELVTLPYSGLGSVKGDPGQIEQVIMNLAVNARDAMPDGGKLTIETANIVLGNDYARSHPEASPGEHVMIAVSDTGTGMPPEVQAHLFEPFFTTKEPGRGTGLGLATCYSIVTQSRGHITAYSEPSRGTTFKVYLPRTDETGAKLSRTSRPIQLPRGTETILMVEDEPSVRRLAVRILAQQGYAVLEATTGDEAVRKVHERSAGDLHLLITDVIMPKMNGKELARHVMQIRPKTKVLYVSGYTQNVILHHGVLDPGISFLQKPFTTEDLACKVREVLDSSG